MKQYQDTGWNTAKTAATLLEYDSFGNVSRQTLALADMPTKDNSPVVEISYAVEIMEDGVYNVTTQTRYNAEGNPLVSTQKQLASQLSPTLESKVISVSERGLTSMQWSVYNTNTYRITYNSVPTSTIVAETVTVDGSTVMQKDTTGITTTSSRSYTVSGMQFTKTDGRGNATTTVTDLAGRTTSVTDAAGNTTTTAYDAHHDAPATITDALGNTTCYLYDVRGRKVAEWGTAIQPACFDYDVADNLISLKTFRAGTEDISTNPSERTDGDETTWNFDAATGLELRKTYADNSSVVKTYDAFNRLATETDARGNVKTHSYEHARGLLLGTIYSDGTTARQYAYNHLGLLAQVRDDAGVRTIGYNSYGEQETDSLLAGGVTHLITETRDTLGRSTGFIYAKNGTVQHTVTTGYSSDGRINSAGFVHEGEEKVFRYDYLPGSNLLHRLTHPNGVTLMQTYEAKRNLITEMLYINGNQTAASRRYEYDSMGRPTTRYQQQEERKQRDSFEYNSRSELTAASLGIDQYSYRYDNIGNRIIADGKSYTTNELNQYASVGDFVPQFDADGNQTLLKTGTGVWQVEYNAENRPVRFTRIEGTSTSVVECAYDYKGRRATKKVTVNGSVTLHQRFLYRGYLQIACCDLARSNHPCLWLITWDPSQPVASRPLAIQKDGTWYTYGWDLTKNICEVYGQHGYIRTSYTYSPYGLVTETGDIEQPIQWSSEYNDAELSLVYYNYRHYNPTDGRWIGRDPLTESIIKPLYVYIRNNPTTSIDIIGLVNFPEIPLPTPNQPSQCKPIVYIFIGGARDSEYGPMYECMFRSLGYCTGVCKTNDTKKCGCQVGPILSDGIYVYYHWTSRDAILKDIRGYKRVCPHSRIVLLGHSYGGDTAMDVSERLENITNITLVTLDPVSDYDSYNWSNKRPSNIDYWINAYVGKGVFDLFSPVYGAGQAVSFVGTFLTTFSISNSIASGGGKWGHENAADVNIPFPLYGSIGHGDAYELLAPSTGERPIDYLNEFLIPNIQL